MYGKTIMVSINSKQYKAKKTLSTVLGQLYRSGTTKEPIRLTCLERTHWFCVIFYIAFQPSMFIFCYVNILFFQIPINTNVIKFFQIF